MRTNKRLSHSMITMLLALVLLIMATVAWFMNGSSPATDAISFGSGKLDIQVSVDEMVTENGNVTFVPLPLVEGNAILEAKNMVPSQKKNYRITITNNGADCRVFFGLSNVLNPVVNGDKKLSDKMNFALYAIDEENHEIPDTRVDGGLIGEQLSGENNSFFLGQSFTIAPGSSLSRIYELKFDESGDNNYQELAMQAAVAVSAILN